MKKTTVATALTVLAVASACESQVTPDYRGEALAQLQGTVRSPTAHEYEELDAAVVWYAHAGRSELGEIPEPYLHASRAPVGASFPTDFALDILEPPPPDAIHGGYAVGFIAAIDANLPEGRIEDEHSAIKGVALGVGLLYVDDPSPEYGDMAAYFQVSAERGYHLFTYRVDPELEAESFRCRFPEQCPKYVYVTEAGDSVPPQVEEFEAQEHERCLTYVPEAEACTYYEQMTADVPLTEEQLSSNASCNWGASGNEPCPTPWVYEPNDEGWAKEITIELGTNFLDWLNPRVRL